MSDVDFSQDGHVAILEIRRGPNNFFDAVLIGDLAEALERCDADPAIRAILLCAEGKNFCAGANFPQSPGGIDAGPLYREAIRLFRCATPVVAALQGGAVGGGLGVALVADFRVASPESRFAANFNRIGIHPGFGLTATLPRLIGPQQAALLFYTGRRIGGEEAKAIGLVDVLASEAELRSAALALATEIALSAPLAVTDTRVTLRQGLAEAVATAIERELPVQKGHFDTEDFREGVAAMTERRLPVFIGR
jgi:enoyl-CoA hydratase/carnithine racemase